MGFQRNVTEGRRTYELDKRSGVWLRFTSMPSLGQLLDGQAGYIAGTNTVVYRDGNKIKTVTSVNA